MAAASTDLHQTPPLTWDNENTSHTCTADELAQLQPGQVLWHFRLTQTADDSGTLSANFATAGPKSSSPGTANGPTIQWDIITGHDTLLSASTDATGDLLNLSHICAKPGAVDSHISTTIHNANHGAVTSADLGSTVHDSAQVTVDGGVAIPGGSTVTFKFYKDGNLVDTSTPQDATSGSVDPALPEGPLAAGSYKYTADFNSGKEDVVKSSTGIDEPLTINRAELSISTELHGINGADTALGVDPVPHVPLGSTVHDTATVTGAVPGFDIGAVTFDRNGYTPDQTNPAEPGFAASTVESVQLHAGSYVYTATVAGNDNYIGKTSADEPVIVDQAQLSISTTIHNATHGIVANGSQVTIGTSLHDTATVSGAVAGFNTGAVSFTLDGGSIANDLAADGTATARSVAVSSALGEHKFAASVAGNDDYIGNLSADEPFTVVKPTAWCSPGYWKNASDAAWLKTGLGTTAAAIKALKFNVTVVSGFYANASAANPTLIQVLNGANANTYGGVAAPFNLNAFNAVGAYLTSKIPGYVWTGTQSGNCPISNSGVLTPPPVS